MEETVGRWWHQTVTHWASADHPDAAVTLAEMQTTLAVMARAGGGSPLQRLAPASAQATGGPRPWLQRLAGSGGRADTGQWEPDVLALPQRLAVFGDRAINRDLYLWLAMLGAHFIPRGGWLADNFYATKTALSAYPGFVGRYQNLVKAQTQLRPDVQGMKGAAADLERAVQTLLQGGPLPARPDLLSASPALIGPVWLWLQAVAGVHAEPAPPQPSPTATGPRPTQDARRRRAKAHTHEAARAPLILPFRAESLMSWTEMVRVNRATDDDPDAHATQAADDMTHLSVAPDGASLAARVRFDLDLPSQSADDTPLGPGLTLPEWDWRTQRLRPDHCHVQVMQAQAPAPWSPAPSLRATAARLRRKLESLHGAPQTAHAQDSGEDIDLDAWIRHQAERCTGQPWSEAPRVYQRRNLSQRSLSTLLLADLSLSTDAYASDSARIIDVIRDALYVFGQALAATGDAFALWGFSSVRRQHVRLQHIKPFEEPWGAPVVARVGAIKPGFYTRMGAAIRFATRELQCRPEKQRLLMLLTDGKPNDLDAYEGRYGLEDTRHAILAARQAGLTPFCLTIDEAAHAYLPSLFGAQGYAMVHRPADLVQQLTAAWAQLARP